jgi:hypothetical protein
MACDRFAGALRARALGVPLPSDAAAHLAICANCQAALAAEEQLCSLVDQALDDVGLVKTAPDFVSRVRTHIEEAPRWTAGGWWKHAVPLAAAAALVAAVAAGVVGAIVAARVARNNPGVHDAAVPRAAEHAVEQRAEQAPLASAALAPTPARARTAAASPRAGRRMAVNGVRAARATEVEVLVPRDQRQAVGRLFASLAGRPDVVSALLKFSGGGAVGGSGVTEPAELTIAPIRIEPVLVPSLPSSAPVGPMNEVKEIS